ncbi:MAG: hypothetical protein OXF06_00130 [Bacteroidetes bacterium]|nr:hypothetical protein [Bacteroidota bacterium]
MEYLLPVSFAVQIGQERGECLVTVGLPLEKRVVVFLSNADIMRAARLMPMEMIVGSGIIWVLSASEAAAANIVGILNVPVLRDTFRESRTSKRSMGTSAWRSIPMPKYDHSSLLHVDISELSIHAEKLARVSIWQA